MDADTIKEKLKSFDLRAFREKAGALLFGPSDVVGVDIGSYAVKAAYVKVEAGVARLKAWGHIPLELKAEATPEERRQQAVSALKNFLSSGGAKAQRAAASISGNSVIVRYVKFPRLTRGELSATLAAEAEPFIPFDIKDVQLSFHILNELVEEGVKKMETVLVAAKKDIVQSRVEVLEAAGLKPSIIDVDSFALEGIFERMPPEGAGSTLCLNIGHSVTNLSIIEAGVTRVVRDVFVSGSTFTRAIMKALQYEYAKAEEVKKAHGLLLEAEEKEKALQEGDRDALGVSQAVTGVLKDLVAEVHRSVDFYLSQGPERSIGRIVLSGGSARMKNLAKHLTGELKVPVSVLDPLSFLVDDAGVPPDARPALAVAVGLALRRNKDWE